MLSSLPTPWRKGAVALSALAILLLARPSCFAAGKSPGDNYSAPSGKIAEIPLKQITIQDKFWSPRLEVNRTKTLDHVYQELEATGCIRNFDIAAGKVKGTFGGPWWADSDVYKWLEGASYVLGNYPNPELERKVNDLIARIAAAQQPDGYLNTHVQIEEPDMRFRDLAFFHEDFSSGHLIEAAVANYEATGNRTLLNVAIKLSNCFYETFGPGKRPGISGHEGIELAWVRLYRATGDRRYLELAESYLNDRGRKPSLFEIEYNQLPADRTVLWFPGQPKNLRWLQDLLYRSHPPAFNTSYAQDNLPVREQSVAVGHAVRAMFLYSGMADVAYETGDQGLIDALDRLHRSVTLRRMYVTGGIGPSEKNEGFTDDYDLPNENAYQETCASAGMVLWNFRMFKLTGDGQYVDLMEQSLYNAVLAGVSLAGESFCYATPLACDAKFKRQPWFQVPCCPTTAARFFPSIGRYVYATSDDGLWVNLYIGGQASTTLQNGDKVTVRQTTNYPWDGRVKLQVASAQPQEFTLHVRVPAWATRTALTLNGKKISPEVTKGYAHITRRWAATDVLELSIPMPIEMLEANPKVLQSRGKIALRRGPLIYCLEQPDNKTALEKIALPTTARLSSHFEPGLLGGVTVITGQGRTKDDGGWDNALYRPIHAASGAPVTIKAIPYCVWGNRGQKKMKVWIDTAAAP
ncbi:MAG TPA: beta-L-arabinofuranosidase domain-containing protein [Terriglobia bacterium]|nr:beta-L-arabinofuranosidase domain-containing protein [Terriglobia bacterium]